MQKWEKCFLVFIQFHICYCMKINVYTKTTVYPFQLSIGISYNIKNNRLPHNYCILWFQLNFYIARPTTSLSSTLTAQLLAYSKFFSALEINNVIFFFGAMNCVYFTLMIPNRRITVEYRIELPISVLQRQRRLSKVFL